MRLQLSGWPVRGLILKTCLGGIGGNGNLFLRSLMWLLACLVSLAHEPLHGAASRHSSWLPSPGVNNSGESKCPRWKPQLFYNLTSDVTFHHCSYILFVRSDSISLATFWGRGLYRSLNIKCSSLGAIL